MTIWRVEIKDKPGIFDAAGEALRRDIEDLGIRSVEKINVLQIFNIHGDISHQDIENISQNLLVDPIVQDYQTRDVSVDAVSSIRAMAPCEIEIAYNPGVMDPVEASTLKGIRDLGFSKVNAVRTARRYQIHGQLTSQQVETITSKVLMNKLIQHVVDSAAKPSAILSSETSAPSRVELMTVPMLRASDKKLKEISTQGQLYLNINEMKAIQKHFECLGRNPTDCELETIAQTWSEHCHHKTFRGNIRYQFKQGGKKKTKLIKSLLKSTIVKATYEINKPWTVSVFHDNAGVIKFDSDYNVCFKVETHNHPSALEPFGGANTGVGGVIRDTLGTGLGAKPICNTDVFCFAPPEMSFDELPEGTLHPKRVMKGVVSGVRDYGNKMGIPTVNGAIVFDRRFVGNPLVFCGNVGLIPKGLEKKKARKGDLIVVVGGRTGRDGIHGATFSSGELTHESEVVSSGAVQIGNPIEEKKVLDVLLKARDRGLYSAITDCGAGGLSSAVGEMGQELGVRVELEKVPLKYKGLRYMEIWISESQERMVLSVGKEHIDEFLNIFESEGVEAAVIGEFTGTGQLDIFYNGCQVCGLDMAFLHDGIPKITKEAVLTLPKHKEFNAACPKDLTAKLFEVISHYNVASKESIIRQYDHEVQGASVIKPLVGVNTDGPSDASVLRPRLTSNKGVAVSNGINIRFGMIDPFWMAASCIDEAVRQIVSVGGSVDKIALLDNFCWGNPDKPDRLGGLVRAAEGCYKTAVGFGTPFISGKDSLYNEYTERGQSLAIPGTILISAIGIVDDVNKVVTMDFKKADNLIYVIGDTHDELGGSIYLDTFGLVGNCVPQVNMKKAVSIYTVMHAAIKKGLVASVHDCSEGGLAVALTEMAFAGGLGADVSLKKVPYKGRAKRDDYILFSESNSRFVVEVSPKDQKSFEKLFKGLAVGCIGAISATKQLTVSGLKGTMVVSSGIEPLREAWKKPLS